MPDGTGGDLFSQINHSKIHVPFVLFSCKDIVHLHEFQMDGFRTDFLSFLRKPKCPKEIVKYFNNVFQELWKDNSIVNQDYSLQEDTDDLFITPKAA